MPAKRKARELRFCKCGCGESFMALPSSQKRYASTCKTLKNPSVALRKDVIKKLSDGKKGTLNPNWKPKETRFCECGCGESFICLPSSRRRFISVSHSKRGENNPMKNKATVAKVAKTVASHPLTPKSPTGINNIAKAARERMKDPMKNPIHIEANATKWLKSCWPTMTKIEAEFASILKDKYPLVFTGNGGLWIGGKCPDFIVAGTNIVIETTRKSGRNNENYTQPRKKHFSEYGYNCIVVWARYKSPYFTPESINNFEQELHPLLSIPQPSPNLSES